MDTQPKFEELQQLLKNPLAHKLFCNSHCFLYEYRCLSAHCNQFLCGKMQCVDNHFHDNHLSLSKINVSEIERALCKIENLQRISLEFPQILENLKSIVEHLKQSNSLLFGEIKKFRQTKEYLERNEEGPLHDEYMSAMDCYIQTHERLKKDIGGINSRVNWKNIWTNIQNQFQLIQKLKIEFQEFKDIYLQRMDIGWRDLHRRWDYPSLRSQNNEGLVVIAFTEESYVFGQYIGNYNVQTGSCFLKNFVFMVDLQGYLRKSYRNNPLFQLIIVEKGHELQQRIRVIQDIDLGQNKSKQLTIKSLFCFSCNCG